MSESMRRRLTAYSTAILAMFLLSCTALRDQPSFHSQEGPRLEMPAGVVSTRGVEPQYILAEAQGLQNPIGATRASVTAGQAIFKTYCAMCHGEDGKGDGPVGQSFQPRPADLTGEFMSQLSDGQLFVMISNGVGRMPPFRYDLSVEQRWQVINYVRTLRK